ncbi:hypothetical protein RRG08_045817 [Elysia crispata]|uniref:Uncharacterized protein n=1 Tax=Elysia crispata TaxID=231223 RepID=A0AAE0YYS1_9GAST|nr:hypothetical protein RRG08_045817 [Elysia crispata]
MAPLYLCLAAVVVFTVGPVTGDNDHCYAMTSCGAILSNSVGVVRSNQTCLQLTKLFDCLMEHIVLCDDKILTETYLVFVIQVNKTKDYACQPRQEKVPGETEEVDPRCLNLTACFLVDLPVNEVDQEHICRVVPKIMECFIERKDTCDSEKVKEETTVDMQAYHDSFEELCNESEDDPRCLNLTGCFPVDLAENEVDQEHICREVPKIMECFIQRKDTCGSEKVKEGAKINMKAYHDSFEKLCNESGKSSSSLIIVLISMCAVLILQELPLSIA